MSTILVFDIDNTLTPPRRPLEREMAQLLGSLRVPFALAAGSDLPLVREQFLAPLHGFGFRGAFDAFVSNGATRYHCSYGTELELRLERDFDLKAHLGASHFARFIALLEALLRHPDYQLPSSLSIIGKQIVDRGSMVNFAPIGRPAGSLNAEELQSRDAFAAFDRESGYRARLLAHLRQQFSSEFPGTNLLVTLGGQTSFDIMIKGNDKRYPINMLLAEGFSEVIYFGDALFEGGNDYAILELIAEWPGPTCPVSAVSVDGQHETAARLRELGYVTTAKP